MSTRFYLPADAETTPISPTPDAAWGDTSILARAMCKTSKRALPMTSITFADADDTNKNILFRQYISDELAVPQSLPGEQFITACVMVNEGLAANNMYLTVGMRVIAADGSTVRKTVFAVTRDGYEAVNSIGQPYLVWPESRLFEFYIEAGGGYDIQAGDRLVFEFGMGGDPAAGDHGSRMFFGDDNAADLPGDDITHDAKNPWIELDYDLNFVSTGQPTMRRWGGIPAMPPGGRSIGKGW